jgi:hypothetical protein
LDFAVRKLLCLSASNLGERRKLNHARSRLLLLALAFAMATLALAHPTMAQTPDPLDIADGQRLFHEKANCQACHGWAGDGQKMDNQMPDGANLRETKLGHDDLVTTIKCGRPGTGMPAFDRLAYSDGRCYGLKRADLSTRHLTMPDPPATLQPAEVERVIEFLFAKVIGKGPMDRAKCVEFWGAAVDTCNDFAK